jgi:hypothetical protein
MKREVNGQLTSRRGRTDLTLSTSEPDRHLQDPGTRCQIVIISLFSLWCGVVWCGVVRSMAALRGHVEELLGLPYTDSYLHQAKAAIVKQVRTKSVQAGGRKQSWFHLPQPWALFDT